MVIGQAQQQQMTAREVINYLRQGNQRFIDESLIAQNNKQVLKDNSEGQYPLAFILSCIDSRVSPEIIFDQALGNIFVGRMAGNVVDLHMLASMEFATSLSGAKVIVIMGHTQCGAVAGACNGVSLGHLTQLLSRIQPAVDAVDGCEYNASECVARVAKQNVLNQIAWIKQHSPVIACDVKEEKVCLVGAMHVIATGQVTFFDGNGRDLT